MKIQRIERIRFDDVKKKAQEVFLFLESQESIFADYMWAEFLIKQKQLTEYVVCYDQHDAVNWVLPIVKIGFFPLWVFYDGPFFNKEAISLEAFLEELSGFLKKEKILILKGLQYNRVFNKALIGEECLKEHQTILLDLSRDEEELFKSMDGRARTSIRKAQKSGVCVKKSSVRNSLKDIYGVYAKTYDKAEKKNLSVNRKSYGYFEGLLNGLDGKAQLFVATQREKISSIALILTTGKKAIYYMGGSDMELNRQSNAATLLQWEIIKELKKQKLHEYDLGGIPINPTKDHPAYGVYHFKVQFGGEINSFFAPHFKGSSFLAKGASFILDNALLIKNILLLKK